MFTPIGSLLKTLPRRSKIPEAMVAIYVRRAFTQVLPEVCADLSESVLKMVKPLSFKNGVLTVRSLQLTSVELQMRSGGLIKAINHTLGRKIVLKIRFRSS